MTIYDFISSINDAYNIVVTLFDCNKEELVCMETDDGEVQDIRADDLLELDYSDYEIGSTDIWIEPDGKIHIEFNIEIEEEDFEDEEI